MDSVPSLEVKQMKFSAIIIFILVVTAGMVTAGRLSNTNYQAVVQRQCAKYHTLLLMPEFAARAAQLTKLARICGPVKAFYY